MSNTEKNNNKKEQVQDAKKNNLPAEEKKESKIIQVSLSGILIVTFLSTLIAIGVTQIKKLPSRYAAFHRITLQNEEIIFNQKEILQKNQIIEKKLDFLSENIEKMMSSLIGLNLNKGIISSEEKIDDIINNKTENCIKTMREINFLLQVKCSMNYYDEKERKKLLSQVDDMDLTYKEEIKKMLVDNDSELHSIIEMLNLVLKSDQYAEDTSKFFNTIKINKKKAKTSGIEYLKNSLIKAKSINEMDKIISSVDFDDIREKKIIDDINSKIKIIKERSHLLEEQIYLKKKLLLGFCSI